MARWDGLWSMILPAKVSNSNAAWMVTLCEAFTQPCVL